MLDGGQALGGGRIDVEGPAALGTLGLDLWADGAAELKHVASLEQSQLSNMDQVANLAWTKACCAAGGGGHLFIAVRIERKSRSILRKLARALLISISTAQARRGVHGKFSSRKHKAKKTPHGRFHSQDWLGTKLAPHRESPTNRAPSIGRRFVTAYIIAADSTAIDADTH